MKQHHCWLAVCCWGAASENLNSHAEARGSECWDHCFAGARLLFTDDNKTATYSGMNTVELWNIRSWLQHLLHRAKGARQALPDTFGRHSNFISVKTNLKFARSWWTWRLRTADRGCAHTWCRTWKKKGDVTLTDCTSSVLDINANAWSHWVECAAAPHNKALLHHLQVTRKSKTCVSEH